MAINEIARRYTYVTELQAQKNPCGYLQLPVLKAYLVQASLEGTLDARRALAHRGEYEPINQAISRSTDTKIELS